MLNLLFLATAQLTLAEKHKALVEYMNVTMPGSLGKALLLRCSDDQVDAINVLQALWLILLGKYLNLEQPCCRYTLESNDIHSGSRRTDGIPPSELLCTAHIADDDHVTDIIKRLHRQTLRG